MQRLFWGVTAVLSVAGAAAFTAYLAPESTPAALLPAALLPQALPPAALAPVVPPEALQPEAERLEFRDFFEPGAALVPTQKLRALVGKRVRLVGFMAQLELPPRGAFYLVPRPVRCDESGGGTADLPPESVLVISRSSAGQAVPFLAGALDVAGILEVGNQPDSEGRASAFRLRLDAELATELPRSAPRASAPEVGSG
jgi:hypothetical protein